MAAVSEHVLRDYDFVLTLNDDDSVAAPSEDEIEPAPAASKKRKRDEVVATNGKAKKSKKQKKAQAEAARETTPQEEPAEEEGWADEGEDDGALASDFEFQVGETTGILEDFDGWGIDKEKLVDSKPGLGGVDIDDIIARRQEKATKSATKKNGAVATNITSEEESEEDFEDGGGFDDLEEDDEELLAPDAFGMGAVDEEEDDDDEEGSGDEDLASRSGAESDDASADGQDSEGEEVAAPVAHPDDLGNSDSDEEEVEDPQELARRAAFFAPEEETKKTKNDKSDGSFQAMQLSRPILKGLAAVGFSDPTPIQAKTIPVALIGKDVVGGAVTGSGKTGAFVIPILERLLYRPKKVPTTRVVILMPTRELAVQCFNVAKKLASFTDITFALIVGGFSVREQENTLKSRPDVVIATPGRFIDHMRNSASFATDTLEILVLDEADRMLEDGFADELNEILTTIPKSRQTMLFSATMTDSVDKLIRVGLNRPVRLMVDARKQTVSGLVQEFVRLRPGREDKRLAYLMYLCDKIYTDRVIVFFRQKKEAHRVRVVFGLCGKKAAELHGSMSQEQRISSVEAFRNGSVNYLLATDLASRGLDIKGVATVLNYEAPQTHEIYLHRVGRTARAGRTGRACTLAAEPDRKVVKAAVKAGKAQGAQIASRVVPADAADAWAERLDGLEDEIAAVLVEEKEEKALTITERDMRKGENIMRHEAEILARPKRTWFETEKDKKAARDAGRKELNPGVDIGGKKEKKKLSNKDKKKLLMKDERAEQKMWKKGAQERGKNLAPPSRDKKKEKAKKEKAKAKLAKRMKR